MNALDRGRGNAAARGWAAAGSRPPVRGRVALLLATLTLAAPSRLIPAQADSGLKEIGFMPFGLSLPPATRPVMVVDPAVHRGFMATPGNPSRILAYDLLAMRPLGETVTPGNQQVVVADGVVDPAHHRAFFLPPTFSCDAAVPGIFILDTLTLRWSTRPLPCAGAQAFTAEGISYHSASGKLYLAGTPSIESGLKEGNSFLGKKHRIFYRQIDAGSMSLDWEVDASAACDNNAGRGGAAVPVVRFGDAVLSYCYTGGQGQSVVIPLEAGRPKTDARGNSVVSTSPTYGGPTVPRVDPVSGRLLLREDAPPNGPAIWVHEPLGRRFVGVIPSGVVQQSGEDFFQGFDQISGRVYLLNVKGIVVADVRHTPLPGGVSYPVLAGGRNHAGGTIAVDGNLRRLFLPYPSKGGFAVVEDGVPRAEDPRPADPDAPTADIKEVKGETGRVFGGAGQAWGVHLLSTGGIPRAIDNQDPVCSSDSSIGKDDRGRCLADQAITPGNREYFVAESDLELGSDSGVAAFATGGRFAVNDNSSDSDLKAAGKCEAERLPDPAPGVASPGGVVAGACPEQGTPLDDFRGGTRGKDGNGFPIAGSVCADFEGKRVAPPARGDALSSSGVVCDLAGSKGSAEAATEGAVALPGGGQPLVWVASSSSSVTSELTPEGIVTKVAATARGVVVAGVLSIGRIHTEVVTKAHGRTGTTVASFHREIADVEGPGISCHGECNAGQVVEAINSTLGVWVRARMPDAYRLASDHGYQAVVEKPPGLRASDRAVNDDDTATVNGLDLIVYNDASLLSGASRAGRSRIVIGLAGVRAESRYGIFLLPETGGPTTDPPLPSVLANHFAAGPQRAPAGQDLGLPVAAGPPASRTLVRGFRLMVTNPVQFGLLFLMWSLLAAPLYFRLRRRSLARALGGQA